MYNRFKLDNVSTKSSHTATLQTCVGPAKQFFFFLIFIITGDLNADSPSNINNKHVYLDK